MSEQSGRYLEDLEVGQVFTSRGATLTESQIIDFALTYDPQPFHIDREAAAESHFGGLIASGFQTMALGFRLFYQENVIREAAMGSPGMDDLRWRLPVRPGDTLKTVAEVTDVRPSRSKPDRGTVVFFFKVLNQREEEVMRFRTTVFVKKREPAPA